jgi:putative transposase
MPFRKPNRLLQYDYSRDNCYFVTIRLLGSERFGNILHPHMQLNAYGRIADQQWYWLGENYPYVQLHAFIVMPDHIHGILEINRAMAIGQETKIKSLSGLIGAYKTTSSKLIHQAGGIGFHWQRSFHDRIIRDHSEYCRITAYIQTNPQNWNKRK